MDKIPTLFIRDPQNMKLVTREVNPDAAWVFDGYATPTIKKDGTNIRITVVKGRCNYVEKRRNPTREEKAQGAEPGYIEANRGDPSDKYIFAAVDATNFAGWPDASWSCEALGPKIQGGIESSVPALYGFVRQPEIITTPIELSYDGIRDFLSTHMIEGIVWQDRQLYRYAKIKRRDFGFPWPVKK